MDQQRGYPSSGWYPDPGDETRIRYWSGTGWTADTRPRWAPPSPRVAPGHRSGTGQAGVSPGRPGRHFSARPASPALPVSRAVRAGVFRGLLASMVLIGALTAVRLAGGTSSKRGPAVQSALAGELQVGLMELLDPVPGLTASHLDRPHDRVVAVKVQLANTSRRSIKRDVSHDLVVVGTNGSHYTPSHHPVTGCRSFDTGMLALSSGAQETGCFTFQLPSDLKVRQVIPAFDQPSTVLRAPGGSAGADSDDTATSAPPTTLAPRRTTIPGSSTSTAPVATTTVPARTAPASTAPASTVPSTTVPSTTVPSTTAPTSTVPATTTTVSPTTLPATTTTVPAPTTTVPAPSVTTLPPSPPTAGSGGTSPTLYYPGSALTQPLASGSWNQGSTSLISILASGPAADIYAFGSPIYTDVTSSTPRYPVTCTMPWGLCELSRQLVPIPSDAVPSSGSDGEMIVLDPATHLAYEFWQFQSGSTMSASWGAVMDVRGPGDVSIYGGPGGTGSGISQLAAVATIADLQSGKIAHPMKFSSSITCSGVFVAPAVKTDGTHGQPCLPEGARIQLDPSIDLAAIPGITPFELMVGTALQVYGAFCGDTGGASMAFSFQTPEAGTGDPYPSLGAFADYYGMPHIPWSSIRVVSGG
ncbi:MAG: DUF2510 domain-containing protein [Acidimicrobiales bacterium]|nr:DUF2510 domain-containing protein [Acidimicrobiales bacterium]